MKKNKRGNAAPVNVNISEVDVGAGRVEAGQGGWKQGREVGEGGRHQFSWNSIESQIASYFNGGHFPPQRTIIESPPLIELIIFLRFLYSVRFDWSWPRSSSKARGSWPTFGC